MTAIAIIFTILYVVGVTLISLKLRDILRNREKYEEKKLVRRAEESARNREHFPFFKSLSHQYSMVLLPIWLVSILACIGLLLVIYEIKAGAGNLILSGTFMIGGIASIFIMIPTILSILPLYIKTPFFAIIANESSYGARYGAWKEGFIMLLILFTVCFPFYGLAANNYIHYDEGGITTSMYFQLGETYTAYEDIEKVSIFANSTDDGEVTSLSYEVTLSDGRVVDLMTNSVPYFSDEVVEIHKILEKQDGVEFKITPLTYSDIKHMKVNLSPYQMKNVEYIFEGGNQ